VLSAFNDAGQRSSELTDTSLPHNLISASRWLRQSDG
jgi:hypothetical protein